MQIKDVCAACGLTKKAIEYYERQGLLRPAMLENGYRDYSDSDVARLKEISVLRMCGIGVHEIGVILGSGNKQAALRRARQLNKVNIERWQAMLSRLDQLIDNYDVKESFAMARKIDDSRFTIREKLMDAFPGDYGVYLSLHFGRFLDISIETGEQRDAYEKIVAYLDDAAVQVPKDLCDYMMQLSEQSRDLEELEQETHTFIRQSLSNPSAFAADETVQKYIDYRLSEEFQQSQAGKMLALMASFQKQSGYKEIFVENLKRISPKYRQYQEELEAANKAFLEKHPRAAELYR